MRIGTLGQHSPKKHPEATNRVTLQTPAPAS